MLAPKRATDEPSLRETGCTSSGNTSWNCAAKACTMRMSRPSIQTTGSLPGWPWSCQVHDGVMMKSPGFMVVRSPSTAV